MTGGLQAKALISEVAIGALSDRLQADRCAEAREPSSPDWPIYIRDCKLGSASAQQVSNLTIALLKAVGLTCPPYPTTDVAGLFWSGVCSPGRR